MTDIEQKKIFSKNLNKYLEQSNKTQKEVADAIGVIPSTFNTWCQGIAIPRMGKVQALADYFHINKSDLIEEKASNEPQTIAAHFDGDEYTDLIKKYKVLDNDGKETVDFILNKEYKRCTDYIVRETDNIKYVIETVDKEQTTDRFTKYINAAHAIAGASKEEQQYDEDIMNDDNF